QCRRKRAAWRAFKSIEDVVQRTRSTQLRVQLFDSTVLSALTYASETWSLRRQDERPLSVIERAVERTMLGVKSKMPSYTPNSREDKWAGHVMRMNDNRWARAVSDWIP
ncbi:hypothetical protein Angca_005764, partial [Angiostrongylus cantonensis]